MFTIDMNEELKRLVLIAQNTPVIKNMWVFGSRYKNTHRIDSDLDIAVEIQWLPNQMLGVCDSSFSLWSSATQKFESKMKDYCPWKLDLQMYAGEDETPHIHSYLKEASQLIYPKTKECILKYL